MNLLAVVSLAALASADAAAPHPSLSTREARGEGEAVSTVAQAQASTPPAPAGEPVLASPPVLRQLVPAEVPPGTAFPAPEVTVVLGIDVAADGKVEAVRVEEGAGEPFDGAALAAARRFEFEPGRLSTGEPVPVTVTFRLRIAAPAAAAEPAPPPPPPPVKLAGRLVERGTRRPLPGVPVAARAAGEVLARTTTGEDGRFRLEVPAPSFEVVAVPPGHERLEAKVEARPGEERDETFFLESSATGFEVVVRGERVRREVTRQVLPAEEVAKAAGSQGDTLKAVLNLPGVARPQFGAGTLVLRGASPGDSRVFLEGQELPILYHFGGLRSTVNPRFLDAVEFLPGNFSADYGRAMGGVVEVRLRDPARDAFRGQVSASLYDAGFALEGPVGEWAVGGAFHRSWIDTILSAVLPDDAGFSFDVAPRYYDYQLVAVRPLWAGKLRLTWYGSMDRFSLLFDDPQEDPKISGTLRGGIFFHGLQARHEGKVTARLRHDTSLQLSFQRFDTQFGPEFFFDLDVWQGSLRSAWTLALAERLEARAGLDVVLAPVTIRANVPRPPQEGEPDTPVSTRPTQGVRQTLTNYEPAAFAELRWRPVPPLTVTPAVRVDWFRAIESWAVDPRLSARLELGADTAVKAGIGSYQQAPEPPESARDIGNPDLGPERSVHVSAGVERRLPWANATAEATAFWKRLDRLVVLNPATEFDPAAPVYLNEGTGRIHGAELLLRARGERWFGWLAYTFQRSLREDGFGRAERPFDFDQPHILTALASWAFRPGWTAGARFRLVSGNPDTPVTGSVLDAQTGVFVPVYGRVNSERLPAFHQLDLRIDRTWTHDTWKLTAWLDVQNAYNRGNPEGWTYRYDYRERTPLTGLPILPIVGVQGEW